MDDDDGLIELNFSNLSDDLLRVSMDSLEETLSIPATWSVFPCGRNAKTPWPGVRWSSVSKPRSQWSEWPEDANTGIDCGRSGLVVLDEDEPGAVTAWLGYEPNTYTVSTGKGKHYYFYAGPQAGKVKNSVRRAPGVDIRSEGGYVVGAGSVHANGTRYAVTRDVPVSLLPPLPDKTATTTTPLPVTMPDSGSITLDLSNLPMTLPDMIPDGTRNETLFRYACSLVGRKLRQEEALFLLKAAFARCETPYTDEPVEHLWARALREYGAAQTAQSVKSVEFIDLRSILQAMKDGTYQKPVATLGLRTDGRGLFYAGRINGLYGDSTSGKTWLALLVCKEVIERGGHVVFIDYEDNEAYVCQRLMMHLGVDMDVIVSRFHYLRPEEKFTEAARVRLLEQVDQTKPELVVLDSTGEAMASEGVESNDDSEVARWFSDLPSALAVRGPGVLLLDHLAKGSDGGGNYAIGSQRKRSAVTGAAFVLTTVQGFSEGTAGHSRLKCSKDRLGGWAQGEHVVDMHVTPSTGDLATFELRDPLDPEVTKAFNSDALKARICRYLEDAHKGVDGEPPKKVVPWSAVRKGVVGKNETMDLLRDELVRDGYIGKTTKGIELLKSFTLSFIIDDTDND